MAVAGIASLIPQAARAQTGKISGTVVDAGSGQPIEGVQIQVRGTGLGALTQANGRYFIISVPPGTYTVIARRIGYQSTELENLTIAIDVTREANFRLNPATTTIQAVRVEAPPTPLIEAGITGSSQAVTQEIIEALPVTNVAGVLSLQQGFLEVPQNTDITSFTDTRRNVLSPLRIRGGRAGETLTLIDGFPVNNVVFGGPAFDLSTTAIQQLQYQKGGFEPQYGNMLSGLINIATKEGGTAVAGNVEYQGTGLSGKLGSRGDELRGYDLFRGYLSGPVPGTSSKLRFAVAGQQENGADAVYKFDQDVRDFDINDPRTTVPEEMDLFPGYRAFGYNQQRDFFGKLTFTPTPTAKINLMAIDYQRQRQPFDFDFLLVGFDPLTAPAVNSLVDTLSLLSRRNYRDAVQGSIRADRQLYGLTYQQRFGRSNATFRLGRFDQERTTCNYFQGICLGSRFSDLNFEGQFVAPGATPFHPTQGTDTFYGGEKVATNIFRFDLESQVTDHNNLQGGVFFQQHDIKFDEARNLGTNAVTLVPQRYAAKPYDAAAYAQDRIEFDFLTVKLGFRIDYGRAKGSSFADPQNPTNGTTAAEVCSGTAPSIGATTPFTYTDTNGVVLTGVAACTAGSQAKIGPRQVLLDSAMRIAQRDDFKEADARVAFSPRIGVNFPLTERSGLFFNAGRYSQNPLYNNLYQNTGVGTIAGAAGGGVCTEEQVKPGTNECYPTLAADAYVPAYIGNPNLLLEQSTAYEVGYAAEIGRVYALNATIFSKDETGLSGIKRSRAQQDIGTTYAGKSLPTYLVIVNQDYSTTRGLELQFRRRIQNYWGYDINYSFSKSTTNASAPDRQQQSLNEGDSTALREITSEIDQPHVFNASLFFRIDDQAPSFRLSRLLRNSSLTITQRAASGLPYTPTDDFSPFGETEVGDINSGRGPATFRTDLQATKDWRVANARYGAFVRVVNLFDSKNCVQVFVTTGRCDAGTIDQRRSRNGNSVTATTSTTYFDRPEYTDVRRTIFAGVRVSF